MNGDYDKQDIFYVFLKSHFAVSDFEDYVPIFNTYDIEYIGGQNRSLIVICKESMLRSWSLSRIIHSYSSIPRLARIQNSLIAGLVNAAKDHSAFSITLQFLENSVTSFSQLAKVPISFSPNEELSKQNILVLYSSFSCYKSTLQGFY